MKLIFFNGGLANQVFQYIFYRNAILASPDEDWYLDDSFFFVERIHNGYELERVFGIKPRLLSECFDEDVWSYMCEIKRMEKKSIPQQLLENGVPIQMIAGESNHSHWNPFSGRISMLPEADGYRPEILTLPGDIYYHGYWINHNYFYAHEDVFRKELKFSDITDGQNLEYLRQIRETNSASVHIRRGDYVTLDLAPTDSDYHILIERLLAEQPDATLFVFSDDLDYCMKHAVQCGLTLPDETVFIEGNRGEDSFRDMQLMSQCKNMIINNSAFCYLAGLLNTNIKTLVNPSRRTILTGRN